MFIIHNCSCVWPSDWGYNLDIRLVVASSTLQKSLALVRNHANKKSMQTKTLMKYQLESLLGGGKYGQGHKVGRFAKSVHHVEGLVVGWRQTWDKVQGDVDTWMMSN